MNKTVQNIEVFIILNDNKTNETDGVVYTGV